MYAELHPNGTLLPATQKRILRWSNFALFVLHLQLFTIFFVVSYQEGALSLRLPVYTSYVRLFVNASTGTGGAFDSSTLLPCYDTSTSGRIYIDMTFLILAFFAISFAAHLFAFFSLSRVRGWYEKWIHNRRQPTRWLEYTLSAPPLIIVLAYLSGIRSAEMLLMLTALIATTMFFGWATEELARCENNTWVVEPTNNTYCNTAIRLFPFLLGCIPYGVAWAVIIFAFFTSINRSESDSADTPGPPDWVRSVIWIEFALYSSFAVVQLFQFASDFGCRYYWVGELCYLILSFASKATLGIFVAVFVVLSSDENTRRYFEATDDDIVVCG